eukprot:CAMPEP_0202815512 /NCGR_PEP_ID=MMETSP1389-20130828/6279_1 /ASSEMBLY_ACC=CAM_ASM_000865 /TAXON_ID=302021 /ORGANISM="Rhodomonas sp., Strain CCMP768" /LENGTH=229 /DNA_ID=CAMNT_0049487417 /DNA_START=154 /DNA_END=843 /DNA_ORIENTATION=-
MSATLATALDSINKALAVDVKELPASQLQDLRDAADALARKLDAVMARAAPSREGIHQVLEGFESRKWADMKQLCDECLLPLMSGQVEMAMQAEEPALVLDMLIPVINFFNDFQFELSDHTGAAAVFLQDWTTILSDALDMLDSSGVEQDRACIEELLQAVQGFQAMDSEAMASASERLEARMAQYLDPDDSVNMNHPGPSRPLAHNDMLDDDAAVHQAARPSKQRRRT